MLSNTVEWIGHYGGDDTHAASAWTSTLRDLDMIEDATGKPRRARIPELFKMLAHRDETNWRDPQHTSPFEKSLIHVLITCDKATHVHLLKHRIAVSINGESARYKELKEDRWLYPRDWPTEADAEFNELAAEIRAVYFDVMERSHASYHRLVKLVAQWNAGPDVGNATEIKQRHRNARKRAKESARFVLPHASMITQDVAFNFLSFMHFQRLRNHPHAQLEVRDIAQKMLAFVCNLEGNPFRESLIAWGYGT